MGMYDEITLINNSFVCRNCLEGNDNFQTKDLDNCLYQYFVDNNKIYKYGEKGQKLYLNITERLHCYTDCNVCGKIWFDIYLTIVNDKIKKTVLNYKPTGR